MLKWVKVNTGADGGIISKKILENRCPSSFRSSRRFTGRLQQCSYFIFPSIDMALRCFSRSRFDRPGLTLSFEVTEVESEFLDESTEHTPQLLFTELSINYRRLHLPLFLQLSRSFSPKVPIDFVFVIARTEKQNSYIPQHFLPPIPMLLNWLEQGKFENNGTQLSGIQ